MSNVKLKNMPVLTLADVLRRRKISLETFVHDLGVQSYEGLVLWCNDFGVQPPSEDAYNEIRPEVRTSQQDGVVVLDPPPVIDEQSGREIDPDAPVTVPEVKVVTKPEDNDVVMSNDNKDDNDSGSEPTNQPRKRRNKKKVNTVIKNDE